MANGSRPKICASRAIALLSVRTKAVMLDRKYDLVMCLEVAEHLPALAAGTLIDSLTCASRLGAILRSHSQPRRNEPHQRTVAGLLGQFVCHERLCGLRCDPPQHLGTPRCRMVVSAEHPIVPAKRQFSPEPIFQPDTSRTHQLRNDCFGRTKRQTINANDQSRN